MDDVVVEGKRLKVHEEAGEEAETQQGPPPPFMYWKFTMCNMPAEEASNLNPYFFSLSLSLSGFLFLSLSVTL